MTQPIDPIKRSLIDEWQLFRAPVLAKFGVTEIVSWEDLLDPQRITVCLVRQDGRQIARQIGNLPEWVQSESEEDKVDGWVRQASWPVGPRTLNISLLESQKDELAGFINRELDEIIREAREEEAWQEVGILAPLVGAALNLWQEENKEERGFRHIGMPVFLGAPGDLVINLVSHHERDISLALRGLAPSSFMQFTGWTLLIEHLDDGVRFGLYEAGIIPVLKVALKRLSTTQGHRGAVLRPATASSVSETMKAHWGLTAQKYLSAHTGANIIYRPEIIEGRLAQIVAWKDKEGQTLAVAAAVLPDDQGTEQTSILDGQLIVKMGGKHATRALRGCSLLWSQTLEAIGESLNVKA